MAQNPKRRLLLQLRKAVNPYRRFTVEYVGGATGDLLRYTCRTCGWSIVQQAGGKKAVKCCRGKATMPAGMAKKLAAYQEQGGGATGHCDDCTRAARDAKYPLNAVSS